jgi:hypothetical protein
MSSKFETKRRIIEQLGAAKKSAFEALRTAEYGNESAALIKQIDTLIGRIETLQNSKRLA